MPLAKSINLHVPSMSDEVGGTCRMHKTQQLHTKQCSEEVEKGFGNASSGKEDNIKWITGRGLAYLSTGISGGFQLTLKWTFRFSECDELL
jgi:hypothetical protein